LTEKVVNLILYRNKSMWVSNESNDLFVLRANGKRLGIMVDRKTVKTHGILQGVFSCAILFTSFKKKIVRKTHIVFFEPSNR
jgi:hypothetical protein